MEQEFRDQRSKVTHKNFKTRNSKFDIISLLPSAPCWLPAVNCPKLYAPDFLILLDNMGLF